MKWPFVSSLGVTRLIVLWAKGGPEHGSSPMFCYLSGVLRERKTIASRLVLFKNIKKKDKTHKIDPPLKDTVKAKPHFLNRDPVRDHKDPEEQVEASPVLRFVLRGLLPLHRTEHTPVLLECMCMRLLSLETEASVCLYHARRADAIDSSAVRWYLRMPSLA